MMAHKNTDHNKLMIIIQYIHRQSNFTTVDTEKEVVPPT